MPKKPKKQTDAEFLAEFEKREGIKPTHTGKSFTDFETRVWGRTTPKAAPKVKRPYSQRQSAAYIKEALRKNVSPTKALNELKANGQGIRREAFFAMYNEVERGEKLKAINSANRAAKAQAKGVPTIDSWDAYTKRTGNHIRFSTYSQMVTQAKHKRLKRYQLEKPEYRMSNVRRDRLPNVDKIPEASAMFGRAFWFLCVLHCTNTDSNKHFTLPMTVSTDHLMTPDEIEIEAREAFYHTRESTHVVVNSVTIASAHKGFMPESI